MDRDQLFSGINPTDDELTDWYQQQISLHGTLAFIRKEEYNFDLLKRLNQYGVPCVSHQATWKSIIKMVVDDKRDDVLQFLLRLEIAMKVEDYSVLDAVLDGNLYLINALLTGGADPNSRYPDTDTLLIKACKSGYLEVIRCLIKCGASDTHFNENGDNALLTACRTRDLTLVRLLTLTNTTINVHSPCGPTALVYACRSNDEELVDILLQAGADIFVRCQGTDALKCTKNTSIMNMLKASIGIVHPKQRRLRS